MDTEVIDQGKKFNSESSHLFDDRGENFLKEETPIYVFKDKEGEILFKREDIFIVKRKKLGIVKRKKLGIVEKEINDE